VTEAFSIRAATPGDLDAIGRIQESAPEAAQWAPEQYLAFRVLVAERQGTIAGFIVWRETAADEWEILNLAVEPAQRRQGVGGALLRAALRHCRGAVYLEVRASNRSARAFYQAAGFRIAGRRPGYYSNPAEDAVLLVREPV
jgi:ribosomal-protein-alanine N-acetyltransferase